MFDSDLQLGREPPGTKLTVMLGGHYWDAWTLYPSTDMGIKMARAVLHRHLGIPEDEPVVASARLARNCLPQQTVGHRKRMGEAHWELLSAFKGQLTVAGPSYTNVGVLPSMRAGFDAGMRIAKSAPLWRISECSPAPASHLLSPDKTKAMRESFFNNTGKHDPVGKTGLEWAIGDAAEQVMAVPQQNVFLKRASVQEFPKPL